ncbi:MAG: hypothetical protein ABI339_09965 [Solirubrobacteraceae bacterium]
MDELDALCMRLGGPDEAASRLAAQARELEAERAPRLAIAVRGCRELEESGEAHRPAAETQLSTAVATELAEACARLARNEREALALKELIGLDHSELAAVLEVDAVSVAPLLAGARIALRAELRGVPTQLGECVEHERTLRTATLRQDGEAVRAEDEDWLYEHLGRCEECARAHSAMLEGSSCYRGWPT